MPGSYFGNNHTTGFRDAGRILMKNSPGEKGSPLCEKCMQDFPLACS
ncbi:hypothetical protein ASZ90_015981 [hydrocarbon metagenome]|uniref:Uncharacterized protein n=1 Tax=hydrocarbon metagenome TaxID=938273 RepID=A0A0W8F0H4_9ZZZZ